MEQCLGCIGIVFGGKRRRQNLLRYKVKYGDHDAENSGLEFENLFSDDEDKQNYGSSYNFITNEERDLVAKKQYNKLIEQQKDVDEQIREKTFKEENRIKYEEERFNEAQNEATKAAKAVERLKESSANALIGSSSKAKNLDYNLFTLDDSASDDDFESFLESVKQRSEQFRSDKTSFCKNIPATDDAVVTLQPKKSSLPNDGFDNFVLPERDGKADGMSSDDSFSYDDDAVLIKPNSTEEWDNFVTGIDNDSNANDLSNAEKMHVDEIISEIPTTN